MSDFVAVIALVSPVVAVFLLGRMFQKPALSPVTVVVLVFSTIGLGGFLLSDWLVGAGGASIILELDADERFKTAMLFASTAWLVLFGAAIAVLFSGRTSARASFTGIRIGDRAMGWALASLPIPLIMIAATLGTDLLYRSTYLSGSRGDVLLGVGQQLAIVGSAICGYALASGSQSQRSFALIWCVAYFAVFFSLGSRRLSLLPLLVALGAVLARPERWLRYALPAMLATALLAPLPLYLRGSEAHGLGPYLAALETFGLASVDWASTLNNVLIAFPITGATALRVDPIPIEYFWISINPLPGSLAGFYDIDVNLGLNAATPFSTIGEVWNRGPLVAAATWLVIGALLAWFEVRVGRWATGTYSFVALGIVALSALFAVMAVQYNLRASLRMLVYAVVLSVAAQLLLGRRHGAPRRVRQPGSSRGRSQYRRGASVKPLD